MHSLVREERLVVEPQIQRAAQRNAVTLELYIPQLIASNIMWFCGTALNGRPTMGARAAL